MRRCFLPLQRLLIRAERQEFERQHAGLLDCRYVPVAVRRPWRSGETRGDEHEHEPEGGALKKSGVLDQDAQHRGRPGVGPTLQEMELDPHMHSRRRCLPLEPGWRSVRALWTPAYHVNHVQRVDSDSEEQERTIRDSSYLFRSKHWRSFPAVDDVRRAARTVYEFGALKCSV